MAPLRSGSPPGDGLGWRGAPCVKEREPLPLGVCSLVPGHRVWRFHTPLSLSFVRCSACTAMPSGPNAGAAEGLQEAQAKEEKEAVFPSVA